MAKRRFQKGNLTQRNGRWYSLYYSDAADGTSKRVRKYLGTIDELSKRSAQREHQRVMDEVNHQRGAMVAPVVRGQSFSKAVELWRKDIAPNLSPATVRPCESNLRVHILPQLGHLSVSELDAQRLQNFATGLRATVSGKTVVNVLGTVFAILRYARKCGMRVQEVGFADLQIGSTDRVSPVPFFTASQVVQIIEAAREPFKTIFALAWATGMRSGELLALTRDDLDFDRKTIRVCKSADDNTREIRRPKTKASVALLPMPSSLEEKLRDYIMRHWTPNSAGILFPAPRRKGCPRSRDNVVKTGLKPILRKLGISDKNTGLHGFRHGLASALADASVPLPVLQKQLRHADVRTTLQIYSHVISSTQREAVEFVTNWNQGQLEPGKRFA